MNPSPDARTIRAVIFDLDDTLAPSKSPVPPDVADSLRRLLEVVEVCVISGGQWMQFHDQLLAHRAEVSGVSMDEELINLLKYQRAFQAASKLITTSDEMLQTILSLKR